MKEVSIEVTHECGMNCLMCSSDACYPTKVQNELTFQEIKTILDESKALGARDFSVSGGEPLQRPDIKEIIAYAKSLGFRILLYTTGTFCDGEDIKPYTDFIKWLDKGDKVIFDVQGHTRKIHDKIMDTFGAYDIMIPVIKQTKEAGLTVETHFVPQKDNWRYIEDYVYWLDELGVDGTSFLRLVPQGRAKKNDVMISKVQFKLIQEKLYDIKHREDLNLRIRLGHPINFQFLIDPDEPVDSCRGGIDAPLIAPWGSVHVCPAWKQLERYSAGNIRQRKFHDIWQNSFTYNMFRNFIHGQGYIKLKDSKCINCEFFHECKGKCVAQRLIAYGTDKPLDEAILIGADPMCWHEP